MFTTSATLEPTNMSHSDEHRASKTLLENICGDSPVEDTSLPILLSYKPSNLKLFEAVNEAFDPKIQWLDGKSPSHPCFDEAERMQTIINEIKRDLFDFALEACNLILQSIDPKSEPNHSTLTATLSETPELWRAVLLAQHYGVIYMLSRSDAQSTTCTITSTHALETDIIDLFLRSTTANNPGTRAINYAIHAYVTRNLTISHATTLIPPNAISAISRFTVTIRAADFEDRTPESVLANPIPMWDLHDFAHLTCATLCPELYGNAYQTHLLRLPKSLTALIRSPGMRTASGPWISDGIIFSELLTELFTTATTANPRITYAALTTSLAHDLAEYLLARRSLRHPSSGQILRLDTAITPTQLAVLAQNKRYELPASEIEQRVFTRGGPVGSVRDPLLGMSARERIAWLRESRGWSYFEVRNTIKHRAHKEGLRLVCEELRRRCLGERDRLLLERVGESIGYWHWGRGRGGGPNLWDLVEV